MAVTKRKDNQWVVFALASSLVCGEVSDWTHPAGHRERDRAGVLVQCQSSSNAEQARKESPEAMPGSTVASARRRRPLLNTEWLMPGQFHSYTPLSLV